MLEFLQNRNKYFLLFMAIVFLVLSIFIYLIFFKKTPEIPEDELKENQKVIPKKELSERNQKTVYRHTPLTKEKCQNKKNEIEKEKCLNKINLINVIKKKKVKSCLEFKELELRDECLKQLAPYTSNDNLCFAISNKENRKACISSIIVNYRKDSLCEKYFIGEPFEIKECKDRVLAFKVLDAKENNVIYECENADTLEYQNLCLINSFKKFGDDCSKVPAEFRDYCFARQILADAITQEDCSSIKIENYKKFCLLKIKAGNDPSKIADIDSDNDGFPDGEELFYRLDPYNPDSDGDGLKDGYELRVYHTNPSKKDSDFDGLTDYEEIKIYKTNPNRFDTDGDGYFDGEEIKKGYNPNDVKGDADKDGLSDDDEKKFGTDINNPDTDGDKISDFEETRDGFDPLKSGQVLADTDNDGLIDIDEMFYGTNRFNPDSDGDGINDKNEVDNLTNPLGSGDMDFDGDGIYDKDEEEHNTNPSLADTDNDGLDDYKEIFFYKTDPNNPDTDNDGYQDGGEIEKGYNPLGEGRLKK